MNLRETTPFRWKPITDLEPQDLEAASDELRSLLAVWEEERESLEDQHNIAVFNERLQREWAIETGIIERIYTLDRGITRLLIEQGLDASLIPNNATDSNPEFVVDIIRDQQAAVEWLFEVVAQDRQLTTSFIKELHQLMTRKQLMVEGIDQFGNRQEIPLNHGDYKRRPNNPQRPDGRIHEYCPPEHVSAEMDRLLEMHLKHHADGVPAEVESAWLHHRFTQIHPFQDGNGRVARALASLVTIGAGMFPLAINRDDRQTYIEALEAADYGDLIPLILFFTAVEKRQFVRALGISREVRHEADRVDQVIEAIGDLFGARDKTYREAIDSAKDTAAKALAISVDRFREVEQRLSPIFSGHRSRRTFVDEAAPGDDDRRQWHRLQVISTAKDHEYFANLGEFSCWARLGMLTEGGRSEILLSLHALGYEYRGLIAGSLTFFRRQESEDGERIVTELQPASPDAFIINYKESEDAVLARFRSWLDRGLVQALETWRQGE
jgi:Fic family protein